MVNENFNRIKVDVLEKVVQSKIIEEILAKPAKSKKSLGHSPTAPNNHWGSSAISPSSKEINSKPKVVPLKLSVKKIGG